MPVPELTVEPSKTPAPAGSAVPRRALWAAMALLCLAGLALAVELTLLHVGVHQDPAYRSFCALSEHVNCDSVAQSKWAVFLGLPVSVWGIFGYLAMGGVAALGVAGRWRAGLMLALAGVATVASLVLGAISTRYIHAVCILCLSTYAINAVLLALAFLEARRPGLIAALGADLALASRHRARTAVLGAGALLVIGVTLAAYPRYWNPPPRQGAGTVPHGSTEDGHPWIGAREPKLTIVEYGDYQCPHCRTGHEQMRALVDAHPERVLLIHRNYPLDSHCNPNVKSTFHEDACRRAFLATCAGAQGKFWEANDLLFANKDNADVLGEEGFVKALGLDSGAFSDCLRDQGPARVGLDIQAGMAAGVKGTPTYVVDGKTSHGLTEEMLARVR